jgi:multidrug efflux system membrane fusion protein
MDNQADVSTGTAKLKAVFNNDGEALFPSQFVNVRLLLDTLPGQTVIPLAAIQRDTHGAYVFVVGENSRAQVRPVTIGASTRYSSSDGVGKRGTSGGLWDRPVGEQRPGANP